MHKYLQLYTANNIIYIPNKLKAFMNSFFFKVLKKYLTEENLNSQQMCLECMQIFSFIHVFFLFQKSKEEDEEKCKYKVSRRNDEIAS